MNEIGDLVIRATAPHVDLQSRHEAFEGLVRRFQDMAYACAYARLEDRGLAEDATQDAFVAAWLNLDRLRAPEAFPGWFRQIVQRQCNRIARSRGHDTSSLEEGDRAGFDSDGPGVILEQIELRETLNSLIAALPEHESVTVLLYYMGGRSQKEVAAFLGVSTNVVKQRLHSARERLKGRLTGAMATELNDQRVSRDEGFARRLEVRLRQFGGDYVGLAALVDGFEGTKNGPHLDEEEDTQEWLANRRRFAEAGLIPRAYEAEISATGETSAYGCIERVDLPRIGDYPPTGRPGSAWYRVHLVLTPEAIEGGAGEALCERLESDARELGAIGLWLRESAGQTPILDLVRRRGFTELHRVHEWHVPVSKWEGVDFPAHDGATITTLAEERNHRPDYLRQLHAFWNAPGTQTVPDERFSMEEIEARLQRPYVAPESYFIAKQQEEVVGILAVRRPPESTRLRPYFVFRVLATAADSGIEERLIAAAVAYGRALSYPTFTTHFVDGFHPVELLERLGLQKSIDLVLLQKTPIVRIESRR